MSPQVAAILVFAVSYLLIALGRPHRTIVALAGAVVMILVNIMTQEEAFAAIDFNVIFLLAGMMIIANVLAKTGFFQWLAIKSVKLARGSPYGILVFLSLVTAFLSALLDNVTTVVLIAPVTLFIAARLEVNAVPFLIAEIMASNLGGTATLIGDPPNILIGSAARLDFLAFLLHLAPLVILALIAFLATAWLFWGRRLRVEPELRTAMMEVDEGEMITDPGLLRKSLLVLGITILGFLLHGALGYDAATIALLGAVALMAWGRQHPHEVLREVEWSTLLFFVGLFILVEGVVKVGVIDAIARWTLGLTGESLPATSLLLLGLGGLLSGIIDNIPFTATMIPLVEQLGQHLPAQPLWWSLAFAAGFGGNLTIIAAAANVIVAHIAEQGGHPISFLNFLKYGAVVTLLSLILAAAYIGVRYL